MIMKLNEYITRSTSAFNAEGSFRQLEGKMVAATVAVAGYKYKIIECEGRFVAAIPNAKNADRGCMYLLSDGSFDNPYAIFSKKLAESVFILKIALQRARSLEQLFVLVGSNTTCCAMCGTPLTDHLSMARGIGPECAKKIWAGSVRRKVMDNREKEAQKI